MNELMNLTSSHARFALAVVANLFIPGLGNLAAGLKVGNFLCLLIGICAWAFFDYKIRIAWCIAVTVKAYVDIYVEPDAISRRHRDELKKRQGHQIDSDQSASHHAVSQRNSDHAPAHTYTNQSKDSDHIGNSHAHADSSFHQQSAGRASDRPQEIHGHDFSMNQEQVHEPEHHASRPHYDPYAHHKSEGSHNELVQQEPVAHHQSDKQDHLNSPGHRPASDRDAMKEAEDYIQQNIPTAHVNHPKPVDHSHDLHREHPALLPYQAPHAEHSEHHPVESGEHHKLHLQSENPLHVEMSNQETLAQSGEFGMISDIYGEEDDDSEAVLSPLADGVVHKFGETPAEPAAAESPHAPVVRKKRVELCPTCQKPREHKRPTCPACGTHFEEESL